jgi:hypothetical protein
MRPPSPTQHTGQVSRSIVRHGWLALGAVLVLATAARAGIPIPKPEKVGGPESCAECHYEEIESWKKSVHNRTVNELHRKPETAAMLTKLGLGKIKTERQCQECHYLNRLEDGDLIATNGISCESCHGAGQDWAKTHGDYGEGFKKNTEPAEHRARRRAQALLAGMIMADNLYALGASCYQCHVMNDEKIVNVGGHPPMSEGFNFLTWSQGEVRHTMIHTDYKENPEATPAHRRRLFVLGLILEVEFGFRAVALATERGAYGLTLARRVDAARKQLEQIQALAPTPELGAIVPLASAAALRLNNGAALNEAADKLATLGRQFAERITGEQLAAIDSLVPGSAQYRGKVHQPSGGGPPH